MFSGKSKQRRERIVALDLLRGTFLLVIFINHLTWTPTVFDIITGRSGLFASAAEGFFVISGVLVGYIYGPKILRDTKNTVLRLWRRAGWLYLLSVGFVALYVTLSYVFPETARTNFPPIPPLSELLLGTITLQFEYGWANFLSRYAVFMAIAPLVLWAVAKKLWWLTALVSAAIWATIGQTTLSIFTAWQFIFIIGIIIGFYLPQIEQAAKNLPTSLKKIGLSTLLSVSFITFAISICLTIIIPTVAGKYEHALSPQLYSSFVDLIDFRSNLDQTILHRETLAIGRILIGTLWVTSLYIIYRRYEKNIDQYTKGALFILGTNSLFVYGLQSFIIFTMNGFLYPPENSSILLNTIITINAIYLVYVITKYRSPIKTLRKKALKI